MFIMLLRCYILLFLFFVVFLLLLLLRYCRKLMVQIGNDCFLLSISWVCVWCILQYDDDPSWIDVDVEVIYVVNNFLYFCLKSKTLECILALVFICCCCCCWFLFWGSDFVLGIGMGLDDLLRYFSMLFFC